MKVKSLKPFYENEKLMGCAKQRVAMGATLYTDFYIASNELYSGYVKVRMWDHKFLMNRRLSKRITSTDYFISFVNEVREADNIEKLREIFNEHDVFSLLEKRKKKTKKEIDAGKKESEEDEEIEDTDEDDLDDHDDAHST